MSEIVKPDYVPKDEYTVAINTEENDNPRLKLNVPADLMFLQLTDTKPPYIVAIARADSEVSALGILEKAKMLVTVSQPKFHAGAALTQGVKQLVPLLGGRA